MSRPKHKSSIAKILLAIQLSLIGLFTLVHLNNIWGFLSLASDTSLNDESEIPHSSEPHVAIIVPCRGRELQLEKFISHTSRYFSSTDNDDDLIKYATCQQCTSASLTWCEDQHKCVRDIDQEKTTANQYHWKPTCRTTTQSSGDCPPEDQDLLQSTLPKHTSFHIYVIEQDEPGSFSYGWLLNVGAKLLFDIPSVKWFLFHDVDMLPASLDRTPFFTFPNGEAAHPMHLASCKLPQQTPTVGALAFARHEFVKVNGWHNNLATPRDDAHNMINRLKYHGISTRMWNKDDSTKIFHLCQIEGHEADAEKMRQNGDHHDVETGFKEVRFEVVSSEIVNEHATRIAVRHVAR